MSELNEDSVRGIAESGKAYVHDCLDINERPVLIVVASKHLPAVSFELQNTLFYCLCLWLNLFYGSNQHLLASCVNYNHSLADTLTSLVVGQLL